MNLIYVGYLYPDALLQELTELKSYIDFPAHSFQTALLKGLDKFSSKIRVISAAPVSAYPKIKKWHFGKQVFSHRDDGTAGDVYVGVLNFPIIALLSRFLRVRSEIKKSIRKDEKNVILSYGLHTPFLLAVLSMKKHVDKTCIIVPDLPQFMTGKSNPLYMFAKAIDRRVINFCLKRMDSFVLLSPHMTELLPIKGKQTVVVDGIYGGTPDGILSTAKEKYKTILYIGKAEKRTGIYDLIEAFRLIADPNYRLWIRMYGDKKEYLDNAREYIKCDSRISLLPPMSRTELLKIERKATVLVNPIRPTQEFTRYFFPSKTMEYLASGTPTIMYRLDCLSKEYCKYIHFIPELTIQSLQETIIKICSQTEEERNKFGQAAKRFIAEHRNCDVQAAKIASLICNNKS
jgi:glycosyltransferase involved in cell wall biosynthesis